MNYDFENLTKKVEKKSEPKKTEAKKNGSENLRTKGPKKQLTIEKDDDGNEIIVNEVSSVVTKDDVINSKIDIRNRTTITNIRDRAHINLKRRKIG